MNTEIWKPITGFEGLYEVSSQGRVKSIKRRVKRKDNRTVTFGGLFLNAHPDHYGYRRVTLRRDGESHQQKVHRLVADAFLDAPAGRVGTETGCFCINHKNGNKLDNALENLEWVQVAENYAHAIKTGLLCNKGSKNGQSKLTETDAVKIRHDYDSGAQRHIDLANAYGVSRTAISNVISRRTFAHV